MSDAVKVKRFIIAYEEATVTDAAILHWVRRAETIPHTWVRIDGNTLEVLHLMYADYASDREFLKVIDGYVIATGIGHREMQDRTELIPPPEDEEYGR